MITVSVAVGTSPLSQILGECQFPLETALKTVALAENVINEKVKRMRIELINFI